MRRCTERKQSGATIIEFTLSLTFMVPLLIGAFVFGFRLVQAQQIDQIARDLAHMYSRGAQSIDFTKQAGASEAESLANQFGLTSTGQAALIFSTITIETAAACNAGTGLNSGTCTNLNQSVIIQQIGIGNVTANASVFGTPVANNGTLPATTPTVANDYSTSPTAAALASSTWTVAKGFSNIMTLTSGQMVYVVEMYDNTPALSVAGITGRPQVYARAIF